MRVLSTVLILGAAAALGASSIAVAVEREQPLRTAELTPEVERAIQGGLDWMIKAQAKDGSWGKDHKVASTALGLMAFMVKGHFPDRPPYGENLSRAVRYLVSQASAMDGYIGKSMYEHGLATLAMSEVWGMSGKGEVGGVLKDAVSVILRSQNPAGGWRYEPKPAEADVSVTVMQIVALASAKEAGVMVPDSTLQRAVTYVLSCRDSSTGGFSYQPNGPPGWERTAAGVMSLMMSGQRGHQAVKTGLDYVLRQPGAIFTDSPYYFYGHYYAIQSMYQAGDKYYGDWYPRIRDALLKKQEPDGHWEDPTGIGTQMAILVLGVPYRFLPIYQR